MTSFYYLYKYGTSASSGKSLLNTDGSLLANNFLGSYMQYNRFDTKDSLDFIQDGTQNSASAHTYTDFYNQYKTIVGSDFMSYVNKYTNTSSMALGDMVNFSGTPNAYSNNLVSDVKSFYYRSTQDTSPYRYTSAGTAEALKDLDGNSSVNFNDLQAAYQSYYDYKIAQFTSGATVPALASGIKLSDLGISYSQILSAAGNDATAAKQIYQNLVNQLVSESTSIKSGTMTQEDIIAAEKELEDKQRALKALDDALYGYVEDTTPTAVFKDITYHKASWAYNYTGQAAPTATLQGIYNGVSGYSGSLDAPEITSLYAAIGNISVEAKNTTSTGISQMAKDAVLDAVTEKVEAWVNDAANSSAQPVNFNPAANTVVQDNVLAKLFGTPSLNPDATLSAAYYSAPKTSKADILTFLATNFPSITGGDQSNAADVLWARVQKEKYIEDISTAIYNDSISKSSVATSSAVEKVLTYVSTVNDISTRSKDNNYTHSKNPVIRLDLVNFLKSIVFGNGTKEAYNMAMATEALKMAMEEYNTTTGATIKSYGGTNHYGRDEYVDGADEQYLAAVLLEIGRGNIVPSYNEATGVYTFTTGGKN